MSYIPDYNDFARMEEQRLEKLGERYPKCDCCGEPIMDDYLFDINGELICEECLNENYRQPTENYMD